MPNTKTAAKRMRQDVKKSQANSARKTQMKTELKKLETLVEAKDKDQAEVQLKLTFKAIDKAVKHNVIHKNKADRKKSQMAKKVNQLAGK